jgi:hypothetical protein
MATELALTKPDPTMDRNTLITLMDAALRYCQSGLLPGEVNTPQKALVIMTAGRELGVPATYALRNIHVVKGKPVCSAELMLALVRRAYGPGAMRVGKTDNTACTVQYREQGWDGVSEYTFTIEDARQAGVAGGSSWKNYPAAMLRARCISAVVRFAFPECIAGLYTPEEMGAEVVVTDEGHVNVVEGDSRPLEALSDEYPNLTAQMEAERAADVSQRTVSPEREAFEAEYRRLAALARERDYKHVAKLNTTNIADKSDQEVANAVATLQKWEASISEPELAF